MRQSTILVLAMLACGLSGCTGILAPRKLDYRTVAADPRHDTDLARRENTKGVRLLETGKLDKAEEALQKALIADVTFGPAHNNLGRLYFEQGKLYLAAWEFEYAGKLMPESVEPLNNLGLVYDSAGKLDEAVESYSAAYGLQPSHPEVLGNLARALLRRGESPEGVRALLSDLVFFDSRPDWVGWAREQLALHEQVARQSALDSGPNPPEPLPTPTPERRPQYRHLDDLPPPAAQNPEAALEVPANSSLGENLSELPLPRVQSQTAESRP